MKYLKLFEEFGQLNEARKESLYTQLSPADMTKNNKFEFPKSFDIKDKVKWNGKKFFKGTYNLQSDNGKKATYFNRGWKAELTLTKDDLIDYDLTKIGRFPGYWFVDEGKLNEGIEWQGILLKDATLRYNNKPTGGPVGGLQWVGQSYAKVPKGTFLIGLPGGLFAVNPKKKFAMALTTGRRTWLDAQDKLKDNEVGGTNKAPEFSQWKQYLK